MTPMEIEDDITVDEVFEVSIHKHNSQIFVLVVQESSNAASEMKEVVAKAKRAPRKKYRWTEETRYDGAVPLYTVSVCMCVCVCVCGVCV